MGFSGSRFRDTESAYFIYILFISKLNGKPYISNFNLRILISYINSLL